MAITMDTVTVKELTEGVKENIVVVKVDTVTMVDITTVMNMAIMIAVTNSMRNGASAADTRENVADIIKGNIADITNMNTKVAIMVNIVTMATSIVVNTAVVVVVVVVIMVVMVVVVVVDIKEHVKVTAFIHDFIT